MYSILGLYQDETISLRTVEDERLERAVWLIAVSVHHKLPHRVGGTSFGNGKLGRYTM